MRFLAAHLPLASSAAWPSLRRATGDRPAVASGIGKELIFSCG